MATTQDVARRSDTAVALPTAAEVVERLVFTGDLSKMEPRERVAYYVRVCESLGLNPLTRPFEYLQLSGKLTLYARKEAAEQLRFIHRISSRITAREVVDGVYVVTCQATAPDGRCDESTGAVTIDGLKGENRANAMMKAETKAKRRVTLSICGLGLMDETEIETIADARRTKVDYQTGEILGSDPVKLANGRGIPEEMAAIIAGVQSDPKNFGEACKHLRDELAKHEHGVEAFEKITGDLRRQHPKGTALPFPAAKACLLDLYDALQFLTKPPTEVLDGQA